MTLCTTCITHKYPLWMTVMFIQGLLYILNCFAWDTRICIVHLFIGKPRPPHFDHIWVICLKYNNDCVFHFRYGKVTVVKYLIQKCHVNPNCGDKDGWTPLHWACKYDTIMIIYTRICCHNFFYSSPSAFSLGRKKSKLLTI